MDQVSSGGPNDDHGLDQGAPLSQEPDAPHAAKGSLETGGTPLADTEADLKSSEPQETYIVQAGDTLQGIALKHHIRPSVLKRINRLQGNSDFMVGQTLRVRSTSNAREESVAGHFATVTSQPTLTPSKSTSPIASATKLKSQTQAKQTPGSKGTFWDWSTSRRGTPDNPHPEQDTRRSAFAMFMGSSVTGSPTHGSQGRGASRGSGFGGLRFFGFGANNNTSSASGDRDDDNNVGSSFDSIDPENYEHRTTMIQRPEDLTPAQPHLDGASDILSSEQLFQIESMLPLGTQGYRWRLLYSSLHHGCNIGTFYARSKKDRKSLLVVQTLNGEVFGGYTSTAWEPHAEYFGTGESFLYTFRNRDGESSDCRYFPWTGENNLVMMATETLIAMGGGGGDFGLVLEDDFASGTTGSCDTFLNAPLCTERQFEVGLFELWGFSPM